MSSSHSPCAACKCRRQKCTQECVFAPYFPPDKPDKFMNVHKVFGASNVSKLLHELDAVHREDAVNSLSYEADSRIKDPIYGCVGLISVLQHRLKQVHRDLDVARKELSTYIGPSAMLPMINQPVLMQQYSNYAPPGYQPPTAIPTQQLLLPDRQQQLLEQQYLEAQQIVAATAASAREQEMMRYRQQQQQQQQQTEMMRFNNGFEEAAGCSVTATGFNQMNGGGVMQQQPTLALGSSYETIPYLQLQQQQEEEEEEQELAHLHHPQQLDFELQNLLHQFQQQNASASTSHHHQTQAQQPLLLTASEEDKSIDPDSC